MIYDEFLTPFINQDEDVAAPEPSEEGEEAEKKEEEPAENTETEEGDL